MSKGIRSSRSQGYLGLYIYNEKLQLSFEVVKEGQVQTHSGNVVVVVIAVFVVVVVLCCDEEDSLAIQF